MNKLTYFLGKINEQMKLYLSVIVDPQENNFFGKMKYPRYKDTFTWGGNYFLRYHVNPYITIDITSKEEKENGISKTVNLNKYAVFRFQKELEVMKDHFINIKDLFYYYGDNLMLNKDMVKEKKLVSTFTTNGKRICIQPIVVPDEETKVSHEGIVFFINNLDTYCYLTYAEMDYLLYILINTDIDMLSINMVEAFERGKDKPAARVMETKPIIEPIETGPSIENDKFIQVKDENVIPNI